MDPPSCSQDVHHSAALNAILAPIRDLNENWKVDLSTHLEMYLREICEQQRDLGSVNFVEAALLIQRSAGIYVKKVEYLWNLLMKVLDSFRKKGVPGEKGHERRKKGGNVSELYQDFVEINVNIDKKEWKWKQGDIKLDPPYFSELEYNCPKEKKLTLFDHLFEPVGDKADFRLNYPISGSYMLEEELTFSGGESESVNMDVADLQDRVSIEDNDCADMHDMLEDSANNIVSEPMEGALEPDPDPEIEEGCVQHTNRNRDSIVSVNPATGQPVDLWESEAGTIPDRLPKVQDRCKILCEQNKGKTKVPENGVSSLVTDNISLSREKKFEEFPKFRNEFVKESKNKRKVVKELRKAEEVEAYRKILATDFPVAFLGFDDFDANYECGGFLGYTDLEGPDDQDDPLSADPDEANSPEGSATVPLTDDVPLLNLNVGETDDWTHLYQSILQEKMHSARVGHQDAQTALASRVNLWHDSIRTKLKVAEERKCMDIHEYETHILNTFPKDNGKRQKCTIDFAEVVKDVEKEEICRYFLASLLLANNYNIEISVSDTRELAMNCMELTLLKSTRHHETLEDYQAPSQALTQNKKNRKT